jgi:hypothetical protein
MLVRGPPAWMRARPHSDVANCKHHRNTTPAALSELLVFKIPLHKRDHASEDGS